jgi:hypothetical protein
MLKQRLLDAGVEDALWRSQFGFRTGHGTEDAIFVARRRVEQARAQRNGKISLLALDWKKAFDSINVVSLIDALRRFGLPQDIVDMVKASLEARRFYVSECGSSSALCPQLSGISQGCTLSPLLFIIVMTVLLHDAVAHLGPQARAAYDSNLLADLVYADDTLLIGVSDEHVTEFLQAVSEAGRIYGMELHYQKFQLLSTEAAADIKTPDGARISASPTMDYLGALLSADGCTDHELNRRIGIAKGDFITLSKVWGHSYLSWARKLRIFSALIESKLLYGLSSMCLSVAASRRLDGFQNRCLRKIVGVKPAFVSRVSNARVIDKCGHQCASTLLNKRKLQLFGKVLRSASSHPLRQCCFVADTVCPVTDAYVRRVGRPCKEWVREQMQETVKLFDSVRAAEQRARCKGRWSAALKAKFGF